MSSFLNNGKIQEFMSKYIKLSDIELLDIYKDDLNWDILTSRFIENINQDAIKDTYLSETTRNFYSRYKMYLNENAIILFILEQINNMNQKPINPEGPYYNDKQIENLIDFIHESIEYFDENNNL